MIEKQFGVIRTSIQGKGRAARRMRVDPLPEESAIMLFRHQLLSYNSLYAKRCRQLKCQPATTASAVVAQTFPLILTSRK